MNLPGEWELVNNLSRYDFIVVCESTQSQEA